MDEPRRESDFGDDGEDNEEEACPPLTEKEYTVVFCRREFEEQKQILLGMKKRGFGAGKWDGFGGKLEANESNEDGARRELLEECSLVANELTRVGFLVFHMMEANKLLKVHVYETWNFEGEPQESEEMRPSWFNEDQIPLSGMWPDSQYWLPLLLQGNKFIGRFDYSDEDTIEDYSLKIQ